ncbi:putative cystathionine gamma-lyase 2 [Chrysoperla carnea]|uniref:putative cystathionine gamma-lyase 2 n=1 Tax=Chrysoperla carnea TaxID=189513 RepID=UPI001D06651B|nr:putative cystathionine gamma-lyase 2 [Chrysoperla carnea]XP_044740238.1 putative cystathionine gamma-lyase 2 [Chrysoperla carnea]XP_044740239.1 putative cystathionine gamma-lyase 2 [Chrysoperla carnea]
MSKEASEYLPNDPSFATKAIHVGSEPEQWHSWAMVPPISMSTTFKQMAPADFKCYEYGRSDNPSRVVLQKCLAALDDGKYGLCFASGLGAMTALVSLFNSGDHVVCGDDIYGGTNRLMRLVFSRLGIEVSYVDTRDVANIAKAIKPNTKLIFCETPSNPTLKVTDIRKVAELAKSKNIISVVDNTFLTSYFQRPLTLGIDVVLYSLTKYMNGHSDVIMGALVTSDEEIYKRLKFLQNAMGIVPSPFDCAMVTRSLKTLAVRMREHMSNGLKVGQFLENHPAVEKVLHPGLPSHPQYELSRSQTHGYSGMLSFYLKGGLEESQKFFKALKVFSLAESLGGYESLAELPSVMTHASVPDEQRAELGITDNLIRLSVGLETVDDLIKDLEQALKAATN